MITVITSCYKSNPNYLKESILSILNQTYKDFEYLIKDDGVDFDLNNFLNIFNDKRIRFIKAPHLGNANSTNLLIEQAKGQYIALQDHDDISLPNRLELSLNEFEKDNELVSVSGKIHIFGNLRHRDDGEAMEYNKITEELLFFQPIKHPTVLLNKDYFIKNNIRFDDNYIYAGDFELWSRIRKSKHKIIDKVLVNYRKHINNVTCNNKNLRISHALVIQRNLKQIDIDAPIELCKMLDPFDQNKYDSKFIEIFKINKDKLLNNISEELYNRKLKEIMNKSV